MHLPGTQLAAASQAGAKPDTLRPSGSYRGFNLVCHGGKVYGVRQSLGEIDLADGGETLQQRYSPVDFIVGETVGEIRARVDVSEMFRGIQGGLLEKQQALDHEMRRELQVLQTEILEKQQSLQAGLLKGQQALGEMRNELQTLQSELQEKGRVLQAAVIEGQSALESTRNEQRERQREFEAKLASLNQEISSTGVRLAEELQQTKTIVRSHSRMWERLARSWLLRVFFTSRDI